jgi:hypothetical protein
MKMETKTVSSIWAVYEYKEWDTVTPDAEYFEHLKRVSKNQIIWGGNYFMDKIKSSSQGWIVWNKCYRENLHWQMVNLRIQVLTEQYAFLIILDPLHGHRIKYTHVSSYKKTCQTI